MGLERLPAAGEEVRTNTFTTSIGGGAPITAVAAARLGLRVTLASGLSDSAARRLRAERVRVINLRRAGEPHAVSAALSTTDERAFVTFDGVNTRLEPRLARAVALVARDARAPGVLSARTARRGRAGCAGCARRGVTSSWDFGWNDVLARDPGPAGTHRRAGHRVPERSRGRALRRQAIARFWHERQSLIVIKRGPDGSRAIARDGECSAPAPKVTPVDTTGAGDAFNAGFLVRRLARRHARRTACAPAIASAPRRRRRPAASTRCHAGGGGCEGRDHRRRRRPRAAARPGPGARGSRHRRDRPLRHRRDRGLPRSRTCRAAWPAA